MYKKVKALCPDGKIRVVYWVMAGSNHAWTRIHERYVPGFLDFLSEVDLPPSMIPESRLEFVPYPKNHIPNTLRSTSALWEKTFPKALPPKYRWIWWI